MSEALQSPAPASPVQLSLDLEPRIYFAQQRQRVPFVRRLQVENRGSAELVDLVVELTLGFAGTKPWTGQIARLAAGASHAFDAVELFVEPEAVGKVEQPTTSMLTALARDAHPPAPPSPADPAAPAPDAPPPLGRVEQAIEVLPLAHWPGLRSLPELLAAFVLPAQPSVADLLLRAGVHLRTATGSATLDGYDTRDPRRVRAVLEALFTALRELGVALLPAPAKFDQQGQVVRVPDALARGREATPLDLALFLAAALEQAGLHALVVLVEGHALAGCWLSADTFPEVALEDGLKLRKRLDLDELVLLDVTAASTGTPRDLTNAIATARRLLDELAQFRTAIDVARARRIGITPIPVAAAGPGAAPGDAPTLGEEPPAAAPAPTAADKPIDETPASRLDRWKRKLLDLSLRNRLINFRETKLALRMVHGDLGALEDALAAGADFVLRPAPEEAAERRTKGSGAAPTVAVDAKVQREQFLAGELKQRRIYTDLNREDLDARLVALWRHARVAQEESGANVLYLALGTLRWFETPATEEARSAPILLIPVELERISAREGFRVRLGDEDPRVNHTLLEKLSVEFGITIDGLDEITEDDNGIDVRAVLQRFRKAVRDIDRWDVLDEAWIAPFSFTKFLMWVDLQQRTDALLQSPVLKHLVERPGQTFEPSASFAEPRDLDTSLPPAATFCPLDSDSSQLAAVVAGAAGRSFVLEGPPGTGKSQTITNLIAQCLAQGKRVLFVAEKMAALEVVHNRLEKVGLGPFCLELHSKESSKRAVLDKVQDALDSALSKEPQEWEKLAAQLAQTREELNAYVQAIHAPQATGESVYQATAQLIGLQQAPRLSLTLAEPTRLDAAALDAHRERLDKLRSAAQETGGVAEHPLRAVRRSRWETTLPDRGEQAVSQAQARLEALTQASASAGDVLGLDVKSLAQLPFAALCDLVRSVLATPGAADALLTEPGWEDLRPRLLGWAEEIRQRDLLRDGVREAFQDSVLAQNLDGLLGDLRRAMASMWPMSWLRTRAVRKVLDPHAKGGHLGANEEVARRLEQAIDLRARNQKLAAPEHPAASLFGPRLWNQGEPGVGGADRLTAAIDWAAKARASLRALFDGLGPDAGGRLRARAVALCGSDRDSLAAGARVGDALRGLIAALETFDQARTGLEALLEIDAPLAWTPATPAEPWLVHVGTTLSTYARALRPHLPAWCHWRLVREQACANELGPLVAGVEKGTLQTAALLPTFERAWRETWLAAITDADPRLREFNGREHERRIQRFGELDQKLLQLTRELIGARLAARVPRGGGDVAASSEVGILLRELAKKTRHKPLRRLFAEVPNLLSLLKPCFLMSPLSVAQYLAPHGKAAGQGLDAFDVVVFDEASQITVSDAVGALARGRSCVIVGDSKQLPPTTFFQRLEEGEADLDDVEIEELESILDECRAAGLRSMRLNWHYRSKHESLITFSNWHYYDNALLTFPAAQERSATLGVSHVHVADGVYDRSKTRTNRKEAESVVGDLMRRLRAPGEAKSKPSAGIVTFSQAQQTLVETLLDEERRKDPNLEVFFGDGVPEPVFVKNLENVQGDERDVILFSIGYGPDPAGKVAMSFGPLNISGGERRLNVAVTRARQQVVVHSTLRPDQIDLGRTNALGVKHLKAFLDYAIRGPAAIAQALTLDPAARVGSPFEADVKAALVERGYDVAMQVGCSGYRVDLAVRDQEAPGRFLLGIECDGAFYHAAKTARDRDRLRQGVLERLGWRLVRVWSTDWLRSREREIERLVRALDDAQKARPAAKPETPAQPANTTKPEAASDVPGSDAAPVPEPSAAATPSGSPMPAGAVRYLPTPIDADQGPFEAASAELLGGAISKVLAVEGPVHVELLVRRVAAFFDLPRLTARVRTRVLTAARALPEGLRPAERGEFLWPVHIDAATWRTFRLPDEADDATYRDAEHLPPEEIANAAAHVVRSQIGLAKADLGREVAALLGFARVGAKVQAAMSVGIELALARGGLVERDGKVTEAKAK